jgi:hypothetical protein
VDCESGEGEGMDERVDKEGVGTGERIARAPLGHASVASGRLPSIITVISLEHASGKEGM